MNPKKLNYLSISLLIAIAFVTGVGSANYIETAFRSPWIRFKDPQTIDQYLRSHPVRKLQLGAGGNDPPGWLNSDIEPGDKEVYLDATTRYPFPDGSFQYAFSEHMIEHVPWEAGVMMLRECYRVLAKGGKLRIVTPNLGKFIQLLDGNPDAHGQQFIDAKLRFEAVLLPRYRALTSLTVRSANMAISSFMTRQLFGRVSNWPDSNRSRNTKLQKIPIPFFEKQNYVRAIQSQI
jgi:SAM-dependent methyltransferase